MPIKQPETLSRADFDQAVVRLRLNVSELAKETGIPRTYLSEFRNGDRQLRPEHQAKLRDYFEGKGVEFEGSKGEGQPPAADPKAPHPRLAVGAVCFFPVRADLDDARVRTVMQEIDRNDKRIAELLDKKATRAAAFGGKGEYSDETQAAGRELFALCSANYMLVRYLTGTDNPLARPTKQNSLGAILLETMREGVERAGIEIAASPEEAEA